MKTCGPGCYPACDFCIHYDFNGEEVIGTDGRKGTAYVGKGFCRLHQRQEDPGDSCDDFYCFQVKKAEEAAAAQVKAMEAVTAELGRIWTEEKANDPQG